MSIKKTIVVIIAIMLFNMQIHAAELTSDCVADYENDTGKLIIPCLSYRETSGPPHEKMLTVYFKKTPISTLGVLSLELTYFEDSHIQYDDVIPTYSPPPPNDPSPGEPVTYRPGMTGGDCIAQYVNDIGELYISCLRYREISLNPAHEKILTVKLQKKPTSTPDVLLLEVTFFEDSHIQNDDFIPIESATSSN
jgi:hypothetical protein